MRPTSDPFDTLRVDMAMTDPTSDRPILFHRLSQLANITFYFTTLIVAATCLCASVAPSWLSSAMAQSQSDQLGRQLGTVPNPPLTQPGGKSDPGEAQTKAAGKGKGAEPIRAPMTLHAGQSIVVRAGASTFKLSGQAAPVAFKLGRRPACGVIWETSQGIVLEAKAECAGQTLEFDYEVSAVGAPSRQQSAVKVEAQALVQSGVESCGIPNAPYEFVKIPGGSYSLQNSPRQLLISH